MGVFKYSIGTKFKNSNCDKTLKNLNCDKTPNTILDKTQTATKLNLNSNKTLKLKFC